VTSPPLARAVLAFALAWAALASGCGHTGAVGRAGGAVAGEEPRAAVPPVRAETVLDNGIRVVVEENHLAPLVAIQVWVATGAADDPPALAGAAHLYEHLVLRGGKRRGPGGGAREIEAVNGSLGAWTGLDETVFQSVVAAPFLDLGLDVLADALANPTFDPTEVERARRQALDEIAGADADPRLRASRALFAAAFAGHGYARPVIGTAASVAVLTPAALAARYAEAYTPGALTVVVAGDVDGGTVAAVKRAFAGMTGNRSRPAETGRGTIAGSKAGLSLAAGPGQPAEIILGFRTPRLSAHDAAALDLLAAVLARGDGSRLQREVVRNRQVADAVRPFSVRSRDAGLVGFAVTPAPRRIGQAAEATLDVILRAAFEPMTADEIERARAAVESDLARTGDGPPARARRLGFAAAIVRDEDDTKRYLEAIRAVGADELRQFAVELLNTGHLTLAAALPDGAAVGRDETVAALSPRLTAMIAAAPALAERHAIAAAPALGGSEAIRFVTPAGVRVLVLPDGSAPLVSVQAAWADAPAAADDAAPLIAAVLERGSRTRSTSDVAAEARAIGGTLKGFAVPGTLGLRADFLPRHVGRGLALVADCLAHPAFAEAEVDAAARELVVRARDDARGVDAGAQAALRLFQETLWPDAARPGAGGAALAPGRFALLDRYRRRYPLSRLVVAVVGNVDPASVAAALANAFPSSVPPAAPPASPVAAAPPVVAASPASPPAPAEGQGEGPPTTVFRITAGSTSAAVVGYPTFAPGDPGRAATEVLAEILGGEDGRLAAAVTGERRLACRVAAQVPAATAPGYLAVAVTCPPAELDPAVAEVRTALARVAASGVTPDEVGRAARRLVGARAASLRTRMAVADALVRDEANGLPILSYRRAAVALARIAPADVARAAQAALDPRREVIAVVHPPTAAAALARTAGKPGKAESER
jgi:zinc protease